MRWSELEANDLSMVEVLGLLAAAGVLGLLLGRLPPILAAVGGAVMAYFGRIFFGVDPISKLHWIIASGLAARSSAVVRDEVGF